MKKITKAAAITAVISAVYVFEYKKGYFRCPDCNYSFKPTLKEFILAPHIFTFRYMKCPFCNKHKWFIKSWDNKLNTSTCIK